MYVHTHTCLTKFFNVQGVGHSYLRKGVLPRSRNMATASTRGSPALVTAAMNHTLINGGVNHRKRVQGAQAKNLQSLF